MGMHKGLLGKLEGGASVKTETTLRDYVERKCEVEDKQLLSSFCEWPFPSPEKKLTFDEWWVTESSKLIGANTTFNGDYNIVNWWKIMKTLWTIAQENM